MTAAIPDDIRASILADYASGMKQRAVAQKYGVGQATVHRIAKEGGAERDRLPGPQVAPAVLEAAVADYLDTGDSIRAVADRHPLSSEALRGELRKRGVTRPRGTTTTSRKRSAAIADFLAGMTIANTAAKHGVATSTVSVWLDRAGVGAEDREDAEAPVDYDGGWVIRGGVRYPLKPFRKKAA